MKDGDEVKNLLLKMFDEAFEKKAWHGPNLRGSLRGISAEEAAWRPGRRRHNIWEIAVHAAYWKYAVRRRLLGERRGSFALKGSNWFPRPVSVTEDAWKNDLALLALEHQRLHDAIAALHPSRLYRAPSSSKYSNAVLIYGIANHDIYHAGQIQLLKRLYVQRT
jgi:uncharacterized damage-inducible protein DinB